MTEFVGLFRQLLLPYKLSVVRWVQLLEEGGGPHCVITRISPNRTPCPTQQGLNTKMPDAAPKTAPIH